MYKQLILDKMSGLFEAYFPLKDKRSEFKLLIVARVGQIKGKVIAVPSNAHSCILKCVLALGCQRVNIPYL